MSLSVSPNLGCAVSSDGTISCWGAIGTGSDAQTFHNEIPTGSDFRRVVLSGGSLNACAQINAGAIECWGVSWSGENGPDDLIGDDGPFTDIDFGPNSFCAIRAADAGMRCWGVHVSAPPPQSSDLTQVSVGEDVICTLNNQGEVDCFDRYPDDAFEHGILDPP